jgi:predicted RNase H-like HicB family nuclease
MNNYKIEIFWSKRDEGFVGIAPAFDGLAVVADTKAEALQEVETAIQTYLQIYREDGIPIPQEDEVLDYSGQVRLRLSKYQHQRSAHRAESEGVSLNTYFADAIATRNGIEDFTERLINRVTKAITAKVIHHSHSHVHYHAVDNTRKRYKAGGGGIPSDVRVQQSEGTRTVQEIGQVG